MCRLAGREAIEQVERSHGGELLPLEIVRALLGSRLFFRRLCHAGLGSLFAVM